MSKDVDVYYRKCKKCKLLMRLLSFQTEVICTACKNENTHDKKKKTTNDKR